MAATPVPRAVLAIAFAALFCITEATYPDENTVANKFIVTWSALPGGLFQSMGFYEMPRTTDEAARSSFAQAADRTALDNTTVWCRNQDYRVCAMYDPQGSVAGIIVSHSVAEIIASNVPLNLDNDPLWFRQTMLDTAVWSSACYFVDEDTLKSGGRQLTASSLTAPNGIRILQKDGTSLVVSNQESDAEAAGFDKQNCFIGMGQHYFQGLTKSSKCENSRPYFMLYGKKTKTLHGFGVLAFGTITKAQRNWFENPPVFAVKMIAPNHPQCLIDWVQEYKLNTIHVFFIPKPWKTTCSSWF